MPPAPPSVRTPQHHGLAGGRGLGGARRHNRTWRRSRGRRELPACRTPGRCAGAVLPWGLLGGHEGRGESCRGSCRRRRQRRRWRRNHGCSACSQRVSGTVHNAAMCFTGAAGSSWPPVASPIFACGTHPSTNRRSQLGMLPKPREAVLAESLCQLKSSHQSEL